MPDTDIHTDSQAKKPGYAIIYGLAEGPYMSRELRKILEKAGFQPTKAKDADLIITHSGGSFAIPKQTNAQLFLHINPSYWPGKPLVRSLVQKLQYDFRLYRQRHQLRRWWAYLAANAVYVFNLPHTANLAVAYIRAKHTLSQLPESQHIFIRTYIDSYCNPKALFAAAGDEHSYLTIAGHHDDCWREPQPYLAVIRTLYN